MWGAKCDSVGYQLGRAYSLRSTSWADIKTRALISDFIEWIHLHHRDQLVDYNQGQIIVSMDQIESMTQNDEVLWQQYTGFERGSGQGKQYKPLKNKILPIHF
jgi:hypothetical protein